MEVSHFTDALSVSFFALLGIWASVVRRHWFLRFATICIILLITLVLPAYEVIIEFGLQMALIATGVWLARGRANWRPRLSLETIMLLTVVAAIVFAVIARLPEYDAQKWLSMIGIGATTAGFALLCLWMVYGRLQLWVRIVGGAVGMAILLAALHLGHVIQSAMYLANNRPWCVTFSQRYQFQQVVGWLTWMSKTTAIGLAVTLSTLMLARHTGWFDGDSRSASPSTPVSRSMAAARIGMSAMLLAIFLPLAYIFYRLLTPPPLPPLNLPSPNGYDEIVAIGRNASVELDAIDYPTMQSWPFAKVQAAYSLSSPIAVQINAAIQKPCRIVDPYAKDDKSVRTATVAGLERAHNALTVQLYYAERFGNARSFADALLLLLRQVHAVSRGGTDLNESTVLDYDYSVADFLRRRIGLFNADDCRRVAGELLEIDAAREPLAEVAARQRIAEKHYRWDYHLRALLNEWAGRDSITDYRDLLVIEPVRIAEMRMLVLELALQAYCLDHSRPPNRLEELIPNYLPSLPLDNCNGKPFSYRRRGHRYTLNSFGPDQDDDHGIKRTPRWSTDVDGDLVTTGPNGPPRWIEWRDRAIDELKAWWRTNAENNE